MRRTARRLTQIGPEQRLAAAIGELPMSAKRALADVADREDLPLVAGVWGADSAGCLVANVVRAACVESEDTDLTLDLRVLELFPEMSSRDLNRLIVAWDEAALQEDRAGDPSLRRLLRGALARAGVEVDQPLTVSDVQAARPEVLAEPPGTSAGGGYSRGADPSVTSTV
jgi:hypothetical protein